MLGPEEPAQFLPHPKPCSHRFLAAVHGNTAALAPALRPGLPRSRLWATKSTRKRGCVPQPGLLWAAGVWVPGSTCVEARAGAGVPGPAVCWPAHRVPAHVCPALPVAEYAQFPSAVWPAPRTARGCHVPHITSRLGNPSQGRDAGPPAGCLQPSAACSSCPHGTPLSTTVHHHVCSLIIEFHGKRRSSSS